MKIALFASLLSLAACTGEANLGNRIGENGIDSGTPSSAIDAGDPAPDANGPHNFTWWAPRLLVAPDQACDPWALDDRATADPALSPVDLTLSASTGETMAYAQSGAELTPDVPTSMVVEAVVRMIDGEASVRFRYHGWTDGLTISAAGVTTGAGTTVALPTADTDHVYRLEVDPWTGWVIVRADQIVIAEEAAANAGAGATESIEFGQLAPGTSVWTEIAHSVHATTDCPLPG